MPQVRHILQRPTPSQTHNQSTCVANAVPTPTTLVFHPICIKLCNAPLELCYFTPLRPADIPLPAALARHNACASARASACALPVRCLPLARRCLQIRALWGRFRPILFPLDYRRSCPGAGPPDTPDAWALPRRHGPALGEGQPKVRRSLAPGAQGSVWIVGRGTALALRWYNADTAVALR